MKKVLALLLTASLLAGMLTACNGSKGTEESAEKAAVSEVTEETAPDGYIVAESVTFTIDAHGKVTGVTEMLDAREAAIAKMDITKENYIAGAELILTAKESLTAMILYKGAMDS